MCVILICPEKVRPSLETLRRCQHKNPHGAGIAWRENGAVEWFKTNDVSAIAEQLRRRRGEIVIHFRFASVGPVCGELRHPFPVTRKAALLERGRGNAVLFQNGTWLGWRNALRLAKGKGHRLPDGEMNDARAAAFLCSLYGPSFLRECGVSRWVYFSARETLRFGQWHERDGIYFSNLRWLPPQPDAADDWWDRFTGCWKTFSIPNQKPTTDLL
ncbi:MAG TPA: hypothetical protein VHG89_04770 [Verrucomicrobiae bacterium]|nr:hypothetical protein [Verrucomicrobiae bacterium]